MYLILESIYIYTFSKEEKSAFINQSLYREGDYLFNIKVLTMQCPRYIDLLGILFLQSKKLSQTKILDQGIKSLFFNKVCIMLFY